MIVSSSMGYTDLAPMVLPYLMCMHSSGMSRSSLQTSDGGPMVMLAPVVILPECVSPLSTRKTSSYS